jgi:hypothetical protein
MRSVTLIAVALATLAACASKVPTRDACVVDHVTGFVGAGQGDARIVVAQNGSPCVIAATIRNGSMGEGQVETPPAHGTASVRDTTQATFVSYTPARDYVGDDAFTVAFGPNFTMSVSVSVVPAR